MWVKIQRGDKEEIIDDPSITSVNVAANSERWPYFNIRMYDKLISMYADGPEFKLEHDGIRLMSEPFPFDEEEG